MDPGASFSLPGASKPSPHNGHVGLSDLSEHRGCGAEGNSCAGIFPS